MQRKGNSSRVETPSDLVKAAYEMKLTVKLYNLGGRRVVNEIHTSKLQPV